MKASRLILPCIGMMIGTTQLASAHSYYKTEEKNSSSVDLRDELPMPVRHQSRLNICYAYTASDFLQFHYRLPEPISALDISTTGIKSSPIHRALEWVRNIVGARKPSESMMVIDPPEQGFIRLTMKQVIKDGYCPESVLPSDFWTKHYADGKEEQVEARQAIRESIGLSQAIQKQTLKNATELPYFYALPNLSKDQYFDFLSKTNHKNFMPDLQNLLCTGKRQSIQTGGDESQLKTKIKGKRAFVRINRVLDQKQVASVDLFGTMFVHMTGFKHRLSSLHTVLIMGREFDQEMNEVRYLIRDTHGTACVGHEDGQLPPFDARLRCVGGYLQVPESALYKAMLTYSFYETPTPESIADDKADDAEDDAFDMPENSKDFSPTGEDLDQVEELN